MTRSNGGTLAVLTAITAVAALAVVLQFRGPAAVVAGLLLALVLPGYAITRALFPGSALRPIERGTLAITLSLAVLALGGIGMFAGGARLSRLSWAELGLGVTLVATLVGHLRQRRRSAANWSTVDTAEQGAVPLPAARLSTARAMLRLAPFALAALLIAGAVTVTWRSAHDQDAVAFSELSIVPAGPVEPDATAREVVIGLICHEQRTVQYTVKVHDTEAFRASYAPRVRQGATWAVTVAVPLTGKVTVDLYREGDLTPYRTVHLS